jgi:hypothetical protein
MGFVLKALVLSVRRAAVGPRAKRKNGGNDVWDKEQSDGYATAYITGLDCGTEIGKCAAGCCITGVLSGAVVYASGMIAKYEVHDFIYCPVCGEKV